MKIKENKFRDESANLSLSLQIPVVENELNGSVIYEEYRGDFELARQNAEKALNEARNQGNPIVLADSLLARGIVHLLQGEMQPALGCFKEIEQAIPSDANRLLRASTYAHLVTILRYNLFPDGCGANGIELGLRWNGIDYMKDEISRRKPIFDQAKQTAVRFEGSLIHNFVAGLQPQRSFLQTNRYSSRGVFTDSLLKISLQSVSSFQQDIKTYKAPVPLLAFTDLCAADLCWRAGNVQLGREFLTSASEIYKQTDDAIGIAACKMKLGDWMVAPFSTPLVWNFAIQENSLGGSELSWTIEEEEFNINRADLKNGEIAYDEAEKLFSNANSPRGISNVQLRRGYIAFAKGNYAEATNYAQQAKDKFEQCGDRLGFWLAQTHRILSRIATNQYAEEKITAEAIGRWGASDGSFSYALGLGLFIARVGRHWLVREGDYEKAIAYLKLASTVFEALGATTNLAGNLVDQAEVYRSLSERPTSITYYEKAMNYYESAYANQKTSSSSVSKYSIMVANNLYQLYQDEMNPNGMEQSAKHMQTIINRLGSQPRSVEKLPNVLNEALNEIPPSAGQNSISGLETFALTSLARASIEQANVLVPLYRALNALHEGDTVKANAFFEEAHKYVQNTHPPERDYLDAVVLAHQKEYERAVEAFERYLTSTDFTDQLAAVMGQSAGVQGQAEARRQQERKLENAFSFMVRVRSYNKAKMYFSQLTALEAETWITRNARPWETLSDSGEMYEGLNELQSALVYYERAMEEFEKRRIHMSRDELKTAIAGSKSIQYLYFQAARAAFKLREAKLKEGNETEANYFAQKIFEYSEQGRARALLDLMAGNAILASSSRSESENLRAWRELNAQLTIWRSLLVHEQSKSGQIPDQRRIADLTQNIIIVETKISQVESKLATSNPNFYRAINPQTQIMTLDKICAALPINTAILQYYFLGEELLAWSVTREGIKQISRTPVDVFWLNRKIKEYHQACEKQQALDVTGGELSRIFLEPLASTIKANPTLILTPYGASHILPFHALPWEGQPLAVNHVISYLPSASAFQYLSTRRPELMDKILAVGDPANMSYQPSIGEPRVSCQPLPAARIEASFVASLFKNGLPLIGNDATEKKVRELSPQYPFLHFATHGYLSEENPLLSSILMADGNELTVYELMGMNLKSDLVVLSACRTGQGITTGGDDMLGLTRGLLGAGAHAAVVSLWPVNDLSTSLLMGEFYRQLISKPVNVALQEAQNYLRTLDSKQIEEQTSKLQNIALSRNVSLQGVKPAATDFSHPHYWAPFILLGQFN